MNLKSVCENRRHYFFGNRILQSTKGIDALSSTNTHELRPSNKSNSSIRNGPFNPLTDSIKFAKINGV
jgi:hypothetical protein